MACEKTQIFTLVKSTDYKISQGKSIDVDFCQISGFTVGGCTGTLGFYSNSGSLIITDCTISDNADGTWKASFNIDQLDTADLPEARYDWQVEISENGEDVIVAQSDSEKTKINFVRKMT